MAEPTSTAATSTSLVALAIAGAGPLLGPWAAIIGAAIAGALWALLAARTPSIQAGALLVVRCVTTSVVLTGAVSTWIASAYGVDPHDSLAPVALLLAAVGNGWQPVFSALRDAAALLASRLVRKGE